MGIGRIAGAASRAFLVATLIATPALLLHADQTSSEMVALLAILFAWMTFVEYYSAYPSIVEFRDAAPVNRMRFMALFASVFLLSILCRHLTEPTNLSAMIFGLGTLIGGALDFPYSPVRLLLLSLPGDAAPETVNVVRAAAGLAYTASVALVLGFWFTVRQLAWPVAQRPFNVWVNLPLFDPTMGGDVISRLQRDAALNIVAGILLPFVIPALIQVFRSYIPSMASDDPQAVIWTVTAWAFLPASMITRGIALSRIADLIAEKRRRAYARAEALSQA